MNNQCTLIDFSTEMWVNLVIIGILPLFGVIFWWWNDILYALPVTFRRSSCSSSIDATKLPPGYMGFPFLGEMLSFLWYFKFSGSPDEFINSKRRKYGETGIFRTHLFGAPAIIACSKSLNKLVFQSEAAFGLAWPSMELIGRNSIIAAKGTAHTRIKGFVIRAINQPDALHKIAILVQPRMISALQSMAEQGRVVAFDQAKKLISESIGKYFASFEPGPILDNLVENFEGFLKGIRAYPINFPGTAYRHALQCRQKVLSLLKEEMEKRKRDETTSKNDLMDGLMRFKDEEGKGLSEIEILENMLGLVAGGYESTALSIMWAFFYLAKYPDVLKKLREENLSISNTEGFMTKYDDILNLKYTKKVVEEIVRMANVASFLFRVANEDVNYNGYIIPKGWKVILWIRYLHTDPENFHDPLTFNPDRWDEIPPGASFIFGAGRRICAGNMLARLQISIFIHYLVVGYRWELINPNAEMKYLPHPKPVDGVEISISKL